MEWTVVLPAPQESLLNEYRRETRLAYLPPWRRCSIIPFQGDLRKLQGLPGFRRRIGNWCILFEILPERKHVVVAAIERRTSTTY